MGFLLPIALLRRQRTFAAYWMDSKFYEQQPLVPNWNYWTYELAWLCVWAVHHLIAYGFHTRMHRASNKHATYTSSFVAGLAIATIRVLLLLNENGLNAANTLFTSSKYAKDTVWCACESAKSSVNETRLEWFMQTCIVCRFGVVTCKWGKFASLWNCLERCVEP